MDSLIIQIGERAGRAGEYFRGEGNCISVGRAFNNDLVLQDPYVDAEQLRLLRADDGWRLQMAQSTNPVRVNGLAVKEREIHIRPGDALTVGRTQLHIYDAAHVPEPTRKLRWSEWHGRSQSHPWFALLMLLLGCALVMVSAYLGQHTELEWKPLLLAALGFALMCLFWVGIWSLAGRLLRHHPNFSAQLGFSSLVMTAFMLWIPASEYVEYIFNSLWLGEFSAWLLALLLLSALLWVNLTFGTNLRAVSQTALATSLALLVAVFAFIEFSTDSFSGSAKYASALKPPFAHLAGSRPMSAYQGALDELFAEVDTRAAEERAQRRMRDASSDAIRVN